jgi:Patatin-like phospholipase/Domain of Unknown Function (DUF1080)
MFKSKPPAEPWSHDFDHVLTDELNRIFAENCPPDGNATARAHEKQLVGLAFSGGGIRSATFCLGVLQALARLKLLEKFDYLSTVSGGGYIGSWLMAWMRRRGVKDVWAQLRPERGRQAGGTEAPEIHFLRRFSNYLTPKLGWLGADMWTVIAVYLRNLILNLIILSSAFAVVLMLPRLVAVLPKYASQWLSQLGFYLEGHGSPFGAHEIGLVALTFLAVGAFAALVFAGVGIVGSMRYFGVAEEKNAGREVIEDLENKSGWWDENGKKLAKAFSADGLVWYESHLDDFILELRFRFTGNGCGSVYLWSLVEKGVSTSTLNIKDAVVVHLTGPDRKGPSTAAINTQEPVRPAAIQPGWNDLEITAVDGRCTVRVNGQTINSARIDRRSRLERGLPLGGVVAIERTVIDFDRLTITKIESASGSGATQGEVQRRIVLPLLFAAFLAVFLFGFGDRTPDEAAATGTGYQSMRHWLGVHLIGKPFHWWWCGLVAGLVSAALVLVPRLFWAWRQGRPVKKEARDVRPAIIAIFFAAGVGGVAACGLYYVFVGRTVWEVLIWGPPAILAAFLGTTVLLIGFLGRFMRDERREWWSRLSAWLLIYSLGWIGMFGIAFYGPAILRQIAGWGRVATGAITAAWVVSTISGLIAARGATTGEEKSSTLNDLLARVAPYLFVGGFIIFLSWVVDALLARVSGVYHTADSHTGLIADQWHVMYGIDPIWLIGLIVGFAFVAVGLSVCLDINQFSMHMLYRNRLGRCYLGASNRLRRAQPFTGFSSDDDLALTELAKLTFHGAFAAPYPIINAALNLVGGQELAWQQRKAASFTFTPQYCGYEFPELPPGFCPTARFASKPTPVTLATAMAISGAAASPNMGYHTAPAPAFLMTVFNVRLGWWLGNPRKKDGFERSGPLNVLWRLGCELFGLTDEKGRYIYLSDGGHFENLGIYELVRRRCRFIVACDAEEDHAFGFGGLGNAIEKCRSDFGIDIDIDVEPIRHLEKGHSDWHCAVGTIHYGRVDRGGRDGILVYIKSSLTGDEPTDVLRYAAANPGFPHQSTGDQWFDESQFESYRVLGFHTAENVFGAVGGPKTLATLTKEDLFVELKEAWHPPSAATADAFTKHTRTTVAIYDQLRTNPDLAFLSRQIYPEWHILMGNKLAVDITKPLRDQLPRSETELKGGFYLCNSVLQLFEDAYVDLNLEDEFDHPDNRGWMNLFKHWSWAPMLRVTWTICASNYGARFQTFCQRQLGLEIGETKIEPVNFGKKVDAAKRATPYVWNDKTAELSQSIAAAIWEWRAQLPVGSKMIADAALRASKEAPGSQIDKTISEEEALARTKLSIEKALAEKNGRPITLREPQQKDEEWFAAAVLHEMHYRMGVDENTRETWANTVADLVLSHSAVIADRDSTPAYADELNSVERALIKRFFIFNPGLAASAEIRRLEITPDPDAPAPKPGERNLSFPFGFAILAETLLEGDTAPVVRLVYFRVQDHLRRMGLARDALAVMIGTTKALEADLRKMHPAAYEVPTDKDRGRFMRLFCSVKNTVVQKATIAASSAA